MEDASLLVLYRDDFRLRVETSPAVAPRAAHGRSRRLRRADEKIGGLVLLDSRDESRGCCWTCPTSQATDIEKPLTHQTIAQIIGASLRDRIAGDEGISGRRLESRCAAPDQRSVTSPRFGSAHSRV